MHICPPRVPNLSTAFWCTEYWNKQLLCILPSVSKKLREYICCFYCGVFPEKISLLRTSSIPWQDFSVRWSNPGYSLPICSFGLEVRRIPIGACCTKGLRLGVKWKYFSWLELILLKMYFIKSLQKVFDKKIIWVIAWELMKRYTFMSIAKTFFLL